MIMLNGPAAIATGPSDLWFQWGERGDSNPRHPGPQVRAQANKDAVVGQLAAVLDRLAAVGCDPAIRPLVPRAGDEYWLAFAG
jgi:hypothetical protein